MIKNTKKINEKPNIGRPVKNIIEPIDDTAENVASAIMLGKGKENWDYLKNDKSGENSILMHH